MTDHTQILQQLSDVNRHFVQIPNYPPAIMEELNQAWQWDENTGLPIFEDPNHRWSRHVPLSLFSNITNNPALRQFVREMRGDRQEFFISCRHRNKQTVLGKILLSDTKKIQVQNEQEGIRVTKNEADITEYDQAYPYQPLQVTAAAVRKPVSDLINEVNLNAARGFKGPGTFSCQHPKCTVTSPLMSRSAVTWGPQPNQRLGLTKRFKCNCNNVTYLLHCDACLRMGCWTTYVGQTEKSEHLDKMRNFHARIHGHVIAFANQALRTQCEYDEESLAAICVGVVNFGDPDPYNITRDPYTHFNFVHTPEDRRYTILDGGYETAGARRVHEGLLIHQFGNCVFNEVSHSGALNRDY